MSTDLLNVSTVAPLPTGFQLKSIEHAIPTAVVLSLIILITIIGNMFVISAIIFEKNLRNAANSLILSLAITDLMISICIMPIGIVNEVSETWFLGSAACDYWIVADVLCCTASILHLVAIAFDRYWAITDIRYMMNRSVKKIGVMIALSWIIGFLIAVGQVLGWKDPMNDPDIIGICMISQDVSFIIVGTSIAFYIPAIIIIVMYVKIYRVVMAVIYRNDNGRGKNANELPANSLNAMRERKATKTLSIITSAFITCWLPFFVVTLMAPLVGDSIEFHPVLLSFVLWLGYCNSTINPVLYTVFSQEFRDAFQRRLKSCSNFICGR